jgi:hypothetical protein
MNFYISGIFLQGWRVIIIALLKLKENETDGY